MVLGRKSCFFWKSSKNRVLGLQSPKKSLKNNFLTPIFFFSKNLELWHQNGTFTSGIPPVAFSNDFFEILMYDITVSMLYLKKYYSYVLRFGKVGQKTDHIWVVFFLGEAWIRIYGTLGFQKNRLRRLLEVCPM